MSLADKNNDNALDFEFNILTSKKDVIKLSNYHGNVLLIVNTASKCGLTAQYKALEKLYNTYKDKGLVIIGVPCNDFMFQEPGTEEEIASFCNINYEVTFPLTAKYKVKGNNAHPFYKWAKDKLGIDSSPKWNFHKYLIDRNGNLIKSFPSKMPPDSIEIINAIEDVLSNNH